MMREERLFVMRSQVTFGNNENSCRCHKLWACCIAQNFHTQKTAWLQNEPDTFATTALMRSTRAHHNTSKPADELSGTGRRFHCIEVSKRQAP